MHVTRFHVSFRRIGEMRDEKRVCSIEVLFTTEKLHDGNVDYISFRETRFSLPMTSQYAIAFSVAFRQLTSRPSL